MYYLHKAVSVVSCVRPNANQCKAMLREYIANF